MYKQESDDVGGEYVKDEYIFFAYHYYGHEQSQTRIIVIIILYSGKPLVQMHMFLKILKLVKSARIHFIL